MLKQRRGKEQRAGGEKVKAGKRESEREREREGLSRRFRCVLCHAGGKTFVCGSTVRGAAMCRVCPPPQDFRL